MNTPEPIPADAAPHSLPPRRRINWLLFFIVLLTPTLATIAAIFLGAKKDGDVAPIIAFLGAGVSGIVCGVTLGNFVGRTRSARIALGFVFSFVLAGVCVAMNGFGCLASGYKLDFR